jgi:hypothetical protein
MTRPMPPLEHAPVRMSLEFEPAAALEFGIHLIPHLIPHLVQFRYFPAHPRSKRAIRWAALYPFPFGQVR